MYHMYTYYTRQGRHQPVILYGTNPLCFGNGIFHFSAAEKKNTRKHFLFLLLRYIDSDLIFSRYKKKLPRTSSCILTEIVYDFFFPVVKLPMKALICF